MPRKNRKITVDGKVEWICRATTVVIFIYRKIGNRMQVLIEKRGKGAGSCPGRNCVPCGYLDYDETLKEAAVREVHEETGMAIDKERLEFQFINSRPEGETQELSIHYVYFANEDEDFDISKAKGGEKDEISDVGWLDIGSVDGNTVDVDLYAILAMNFCFGHDKLIVQHLSKYFHLEYEK